jgi:DNA-binding MarR family transcriptional regulator
MQSICRPKYCEVVGLKRTQAEGYVIELQSLLPQAMHLFIRNDRKEIWDMGITLPQFFCLKVLTVKNECMMKKLAEDLELSMGTVTGIVDRLIKTGLVERHRDESDRRIVQVRPTKAGKQLLENATKKKREHLISVLENVDEKDMEAFIGSLHNFLLAIDKHSSEPEETE